MQVLLLTRGIKSEVDRWSEELSSKFFEWPRGDNEKDKETQVIQMGLRPWQMWELAFPKEAYGQVMTFIHPHGLGKHPSFVNNYVMLLRKALKLKEFPKWDVNQPRMIGFQAPNVSKIMIGMKYDIKHPETGREMI